MNESLAAWEDGRSVIVVERPLAHPPARVWRALTDPDDLAAWFPWTVEIDVRLDGKLRFSFDGGAHPETSGVITEYDPPRLLAFTWGDDLLRWEVRPDGDGTLLVLNHVFADRPSAASFAAGWTGCLDRMDSRLGGSPASVSASSPASSPGAEPWAARHEAFVAEFGLADGAVADAPAGWEVRFERQLTRPVADVWTALTTSCAAPPTVGDHVPEAFTIPAAPAGRITDTDGATRLAYVSGAGGVSWLLRDGNGGARLVVVQTGPAADAAARDAALAGWRSRIETLSAELVAAAEPNATP
jgi:uncharacterized protein YndB with AHSA1/START domain